ncbi:MAG TPA: GNAT family N-acetyltransferase [Trebonia sp.]|jgi:RimJ/RimL family protein N-acetyltransferase|nr:GNAT family N-acetyltransferase [Trebonia sp.]
MRILPLDVTDDDAVRACYDLWTAVTRADDPFDAPESLRSFRTMLTMNWSGAATEAWYVPGESGGSAGPGEIAAACHLQFPDRENRDWAFGEVYVHPARRRHGLGTALLRHAGKRATAHARTLLGGHALTGSAGEAFALRLRGKPGLDDVRRVQELRKLPAGRVAALRAGAERAAGGYSLARWEGITPDDRLEQVAALHNALNDAPREAGVEPHLWDAQQVRERSDARTIALGRRRYSLAASCDATGELAALTVVGVDPDVPDWGHQAVTMVTRPHRGHRLGLLVKTAMLEWLAAAEPQVARIVTWNAAANEHMIGINEALGYEVRGRPYRSYELPVTAIDGQS